MEKELFLPDPSTPPPFFFIFFFFFRYASTVRPLTANISNSVRTFNALKLDVKWKKKKNWFYRSAPLVSRSDWSNRTTESGSLSGHKSEYFRIPQTPLFDVCLPSLLASRFVRLSDLLSVCLSAFLPLPVRLSVSLSICSFGCVPVCVCLSAKFVDMTLCPSAFFYYFFIRLSV